MGRLTYRVGQSPIEPSRRPWATGLCRSRPDLFATAVARNTQIVILESGASDAGAGSPTFLAMAIRGRRRHPCRCAPRPIGGRPRRKSAPG